MRRGHFKVVVNGSRYTTASIKRFLRAAMEAEGIDPTGYRVWIRPCRRVYDKSAPCGWGTLGAKRTCLTIPAPEHLDMVQLASVVVHEMAHNRGILKHHEMLSPWDGSLDVSWVKGLTLEPKVKTLPPKRDLINERHIHAAQMLAKHETLFNKEKRLAKKWRDKVRYYERAQAKRAAAPAKKED